MDLVSRLKHYLDSRQISITQFADECGIPRPTGSQLLAGRNKKVSDEIIGKIHAAYPDLNIVWLMFGEGNMETDGNIEISEPQKDIERTQSSNQYPDEQTIDFEIGYENNVPQKQAEKIQASINAPNTATTFTFSPSAEPSAEQPGEILKQTDGMDQNNDDPAITLTPGKGKRVTGIVVYYDDCTYESFIPDPAHGHPFMR